jgi:hypothetical protein
MNKITKETRRQREKQNFMLPLFFLSLLALIAVFSLSSFQDTIQADVLDTVALIPETLPDDTTAIDALDLVDEETDVDETVTDIAFVRGEYTARHKRIGERLFKGLVGFSSGMHNCASCHYTEPQKEMNWNPAAWELAKLWEGTDGYSIMQVMNNPMGARMMEDHEGMTINQQEQHLLEAYYASLLEKGPGEMKAYPIRAAIFWGLGVLMLLALVDLIITRKIKFKAIHILILLVGLAVHGQFAMTEAIALGRTEGYAPDQPIKFSHLIHAGENEIDCRYCHYIADYSLSGGIPSNNVCMNCHNVVRNGTYSGRFEINKIHQAAESGEPVEWIRIHKLPDHSFFSHAQHVNAGKLDCSECHGQVETMHILQQVEDLSMGWCLTCHRENHVDFLDNPYFHIYEKLHQKILSGEIDGVTAAEIGGEDCMKCHY